MFNLEQHRHEYHYDLHTIIPETLPSELCKRLTSRLQELIEGAQIPLVDHQGLGTTLELDGGGRYRHYLVDGPGIRKSFPELEGAYHSLARLVATISSQDVIVSPYGDSDMNIKAYPPNGGTIGAHFDTNGISVLLYLTTNSEGPLRLTIERPDPWKGTEMEQPGRVENRDILAVEGSMVLMQGRRLWHDSMPMTREFKAVAVFNYYWRGDTRRPGHFDDFVYRGQDPKEVQATAEDASSTGHAIDGSEPALVGCG